MTRERPILFSAPMVRAILDGRKTQTRRVIANAPLEAGCARWVTTYGESWVGAVFFAGSTPESRGLASIRCPYGSLGQLLYVKEAVTYVPDTAYSTVDVPQTPNPNDPNEVAVYKAGWDRVRPSMRWRSGRFMPRWASRIWLTVVDVRVERLQAISEADMRAEGVGHVDNGDPSCGFMVLWDSINTKRGYGWETNPWVWAVTFERIKASQ